MIYSGVMIWVSEKHRETISVVIDTVQIKLNLTEFPGLSLRKKCLKFTHSEISLFSSFLLAFAIFFVWTKVLSLPVYNHYHIQIGLLEWEMLHSSVPCWCTQRRVTHMQRHLRNSRNDGRENKTLTEQEAEEEEAKPWPELQKQLHLCSYRATCWLEQWFVEVPMKSQSFPFFIYFVAVTKEVLTVHIGNVKQDSYITYAHNFLKAWLLKEDNYAWRDLFRAATLLRDR